MALYDSPAGRDLCKHVLKKHLPYEPHNYQLDGVCPVLDGLDLLATTPTGSGKTGYLTQLMLMAIALAKDPSLRLNERVFPLDPAMIVVSPTKALEDDMAEQMRKVGLRCVVINEDTIDEARKCGRNLWQEVRTDIAVILMSPELLTSLDFAHLLDRNEFWSRIFAMGVDEAHLLYFWGVDFRKSFRNIGLMRERLPSKGDSQTPLVAITATLRTGTPMQTICTFLGLQDGRHHFIRRSNSRSDIQYITRNMQSGMRSLNFPELDWVLTDDQKTIIFCSTIAFGFQVVCYLWRQAQLINFANPEEHICMYNSLNWPSYNKETLGFLNNNPDTQKIVATEALSVGINSPMQNVVQFGLPRSLEELVQKFGRIRANEGNARAILYIPQKSHAKARKVLARKCTPQDGVLEAELEDSDDEETQESSGVGDGKLVATQLGSEKEDNRAADGAAEKKTEKKTKPMDVGVAKLVLAECIPELLDKEFDNKPGMDPICKCKTCHALPTASTARSIDDCICSGCQPEDKPKQKRAPRTKQTNTIPEGTGILTTAMRTDNSTSTRLLVPSTILPDQTINALLDSLFTFNKIEDVAAIIAPNHHLHPFTNDLFKCLKQMKAAFSIGDDVEDASESPDDSEPKTISTTFQVANGEINFHFDAS
ncbi:hypothetical protein HWV62_13990 [Athelia sp. TMB]|nr:hypothetical protein HWV62_13990 [Athelia sp. TMB]